MNLSKCVPYITDRWRTNRFCFARDSFTSEGSVCLFARACHNASGRPFGSVRV